MNSSKKNDTNTDFFGKAGAYMKKLPDQIRKYDRYTLICLITGVIFFLFATLQLVLMLLTPQSASFDHISVIVLDYIIVALCLAFVLYKSGRLDGMIPEGMEEKLHALDSPADEHSDSPEPEKSTPEKSASEFIAMGHLSSSGQSVKNSSGSVNAAGIDESLISPGHRYSSEYMKQQDSPDNQKNIRREDCAGTAGGAAMPRFHSRRVNG